MAQYAENPTVYETDLSDEIELVDSDIIVNMFRDPGSHDASNYIINMEPSPTSRRKSVKVFASKRVYDMLWRRHLYARVDVMDYFHGLFRVNQSTAAAAGWVFESRVHQLLQQQRNIQLFPVRGSFATKNFNYNCYIASQERSDAMNLCLSDSAEVPLTEGCHVEKECYYRPRSTNFPTIDSLVLVHPQGEPSPLLLTFQITGTRDQHGVNPNGLLKIRNLAPGARKLYVVVTPESIHPTIVVPESLLSGGRQRKLSTIKGVVVDKVEKVVHEGFPVFHYPVRMEELFPPSRA